MRDLDHLGLTKQKTSSPALLFLQGLLIEGAVGIAIVGVLLLIFAGISNFSDFVAVHFGMFILVSFGAVWAVRMGWGLWKRASYQAEERRTR
jgi:hypothetical protein